MFACLPKPRALGPLLGLVMAGVIGLAMMHHPMLLSGFARIQTETNDSRFINYGLEHTYRWIAGSASHRSFWDPPIFYPAPNVTAFADTLLTVAPLYWSWRVLGFLPDTSFQLWMLTASALNYLAGYWLMREGFRLGFPGAICGAFLFAFSAPRANEIEHQQLSLQLYTVLTLIALLRVFRDRPARPRGAFVLWSVAGLSLVAQLYASFYLGWFLAVAFVMAGVAAIALPPYRAVVIAVAREQWPAIGGAALLTLLAMLPLAEHYLAAAAAVGVRDYEREVVHAIADWRSWIYLGPQSWMFGWLSRLDALSFPVFEQAMRRGLGIVTPLLCLIGLALRRNDATLRLVGIATLGLIVATMRFDRHVWAGMGLGLCWTCVVQLVGHARTVRERALLAVSMLLLAVTFLPAMMSQAALVTGLMAALFATAWVWLTRTPVAVGPLVVASLVVCATAWVFAGDVIYWPYVASAIPGGRALRVVARALLLAIIPAAVGFGAFFDWAWQRRRRLGWALVLAVVAVFEQGVTTSAFDKFGTRSAVAEVARQVNGQWQCFYYSPRLSEALIVRYGFDHMIVVSHLDAMWAELQTGVPTINGYSGSSPPGWLTLYASNITRDGDRERVQGALAGWASRHSMSPERVGWIVGR